MSILVGTLIGVAVYEVLLRPLLLRAFYRIRSWWRFGRRRTVPKNTTTTASLDAMIRSTFVRAALEDRATQEHALLRKEARIKVVNGDLEAGRIFVKGDEK